MWNFAFLMNGALQACPPLYQTPTPPAGPAVVSKKDMFEIIPMV
jgi:hypothetical protein